MNVTLLFFDSCPSWQRTDAELTALAEEFGFSLELERVNTPEDAERMRFRGSPTVLIDGDDPFGRATSPSGCRVACTAPTTGWPGSRHRGNFAPAIETPLASRPK